MSAGAMRFPSRGRWLLWLIVRIRTGKCRVDGFGCGWIGYLAFLAL